MRNILFIAGFMITALLSCTKEAKYEVAENPPDFGATQINYS